MEPAMPPDFTRARRRLTRRIARMNRSLRALAASSRVRAGIVAARMDVKWRGWTARVGRAVSAPQIPARIRTHIDRVVVLARAHNSSIRRAVRRWRADGAWKRLDRTDRPRGGLDQISERLNFGFSPKLPVLRQTEAAECGLVCLAMVASFHGLRTDPAAIRSRYLTSSRRLTLSNIMTIAAPPGPCA